MLLHLISLQILVSSTLGEAEPKYSPPYPGPYSSLHQSPYSYKLHLSDCHYVNDTECVTQENVECGAEEKEVCVEVLETECEEVEEEVCTRVETQECEEVEKTACAMFQTQECKVRQCKFCQDKHY